MIYLYGYSGCEKVEEEGRNRKREQRGRKDEIREDGTFQEYRMVLYVS
jgi:hypothetical protein